MIPPASASRRFDDRPEAHDPLLSIICAVRNGEATLRQMIDSYAVQQTVQTELLVIDALSNDSTWSIVESCRGTVVAALSEADRGIYDAWNKALPMCRGRYVAFIGCDDRLAPGALQALVAAIDAQPADAPDAPHLIAGFNVLTRQGTPVGLLGEAFRLDRLPRRLMIAHVMAAHQRTWMIAAGGYDSSFRSSGDYELLLRERKGLRVKTLPAILAFMEDGGTSRQRWTPHLENFRARRKAGLGTALSTWLFVRAIAFTALRILNLK